MLLHQALDVAASRNPARELAMEPSGRRCTYGDMLATSQAVAARLRERGVRAGDRVVLALSNSCDWMSALFGISRVGAIAVPANPRIGPAGLHDIVRRCESTLVVGELSWKGRRSSIVLAGSDVCASWSGATSAEPFASWLSSGGGEPEPVPPRCDDDAALIFFTSGTTGQPRGVILSHRNVVENARAVVRVLGITPDDRAMVILPFSYVYGFSVLLTHVLCGATLLIDNRFTFPDIVLDAMGQHGATSLAGVPSTYTLLLSRRKLREMDWSTMRYVTQAGGALAPRFLAQLREVLPASVRIHVMYGQTEAGPRLTCLPSEDLVARFGSVGKPIPGVRIRIVQPDGTDAPARVTGEVVASGPGVMHGYWRDDAATSQVLRNGGLATGDLGWMDEDGYLYIEGRNDFLVKSRGIRINPVKCEEALLELTGIREAAVVGMPHPLQGEALRAFVVTDGTVTEATVIEHCRRRLPSYLVPSEIRFIPDLPKDSSGKIRKRDLLAVVMPADEKEVRVGRST